MVNEVNETLQLPFVYSFPSNAAFKHVHQGPMGKKHGAAIIVSPRLAQFVKPMPHLDDEGLTCHVLVSLPGTPPISLISIYAPPHDTSRRKTIETAIHPYLTDSRVHTSDFSGIRLDNRNHLVAGGDFNAILQDDLDAKNLKRKNEWPWLSNHVLPDPNNRRTLIDIFRTLNPFEKAFTRYWTEAHPSETRLDLLLTTPAT